MRKEDKKREALLRPIPDESESADDADAAVRISGPRHTSPIDGPTYMTCVAYDPPPARRFSAAIQCLDSSAVISCGCPEGERRRGRRERHARGVRRGEAARARQAQEEGAAGAPHARAREAALGGFWHERRHKKNGVRRRARS